MDRKFKKSELFREALIAVVKDISVMTDYELYNATIDNLAHELSSALYSEEYEARQKNQEAAEGDKDNGDTI